ncbi:hypothetical protein D4M43_19215 [Escherichia coli]|nr:hypothetical protein D4M43_19215 [Escherichia coli]
MIILREVFRSYVDGKLPWMSSGSKCGYVKKSPGLAAEQKDWTVIQNIQQGRMQNWQKSEQPLRLL